MKRLAGILIAGIFAATLSLVAPPADTPVAQVVAPAPAQAAEGSGNIKICVYWSSYTWIRAFKTDGSYSNQLTQFDDNGDDLGECTGWQTPSGMRVDTDPTGLSHSWRTKYIKDGSLNVDAWPWGECHENSDNHSADPVNPPPSENWRIVYKNYDDGDCTN